MSFFFFTIAAMWSETAFRWRNTLKKESRGCWISIWIESRSYCKYLCLSYIQFYFTLSPQLVVHFLATFPPDSTALRFVHPLVCWLSPSAKDNDLFEDSIYSPQHRGYDFFISSSHFFPEVPFRLHQLRWNFNGEGIIVEFSRIDGDPCYGTSIMYVRKFGIRRISHCGEQIDR